jgi:hypothetical protein
MGLDVMTPGDYPRLDALLERGGWGRGRDRGVGFIHIIVHDEDE